MTDAIRDKTENSDNRSKQYHFGENLHQKNSIRIDREATHIERVIGKYFFVRDKSKRPPDKRKKAND